LPIFLFVYKFWFCFLELRKEETKSLKKFLLAQSLMLSLSQLVPIFSTALTFLAMTLSGNNISFTQVVSLELQFIGSFQFMLTNFHEKAISFK